MTITYNTGIPAGSHNPSADQPLMLVNTNNIATYVAIDHVAFGTAGSGQHKQVTFNAPLGSDPNLATPIGSLYTKTSATTNTSDLYWQNGALAANVVQFTAGGITASSWAQFNGAGGAVLNTNENVNIASVSRASAGNYTLNFTRNYQFTTYCVQVTPNIGGGSTAIQLAKSASSLNFIVRVNGTPTDSNDINVVIFGKLT